MNTRILSQVARRAMVIAAVSSCITMLGSTAFGQNNGLQYDPATNIAYRQVVRTIERPVVETQIEKVPQTVYRPQTVTETRPESRTIYSPVVEYGWEPRLHGRWNPFRQPTVQYHHVPRTRWEARSEVVERTNTRTEWIAEKRTVDVPKRIVRMQREQRVDLEPVGPVTPTQAAPAGVSTAIASRLRPLENGMGVQSFGQSRLAAGTSFVAPRIAANTVGRLTSDPPRRTTGQGGMPATQLNAAPSGVRGQALPPVNSGTGLASPAFRMFR